MMDQSSSRAKRNCPGLHLLLVLPALIAVGVVGLPRSVAATETHQPAKTNTTLYRLARVRSSGSVDDDRATLEHQLQILESLEEMKLQMAQLLERHVLQRPTTTRPRGDALVTVNVTGVSDYRVVDEFIVSTSGEAMLFDVKMPRDAHVTLTQQRGVYESGTMYEIVIGGWSNTRSVIRKHGHVEMVHANTNGFLRVDTFRPFWISFKEGVIRVGERSLVGRNIFMQYLDPTPFTVNYVAVNGCCGAQGTFVIY